MPIFDHLVFAVASTSASAISSIDMTLNSTEKKPLYTVENSTERFFCTVENSTVENSTWRFFCTIQGHVMLVLAWLLGERVPKGNE